MYSGSGTRGSTPLGDNSDSETGSHGEGRLSVTLNKVGGRSREGHAKVTSHFDELGRKIS
jgi:hypothetical protein